MNANTEEYFTVSDFSNAVKAFLSFLLKKWLIILFAIITGVAFGVSFYYLQKPKYEATCTFILEEKQSGLGGLSGLASQFGFDIGGLTGGGSIFAGDNILEILKSRKIIQNVLLSEIDSNDHKKKLVDLFIEEVGWKKKWQDDKQLNNISFEKAGSPLIPISLQQDSVLDLVHEAILKKYLFLDRASKKSSIIMVRVEFQNDVFAKLVSERIVNSAMQMYIQFKTSNASINVKRLENKADSLLYLLNRKSYQTASSIVIDANPALKSLSVPSELNGRDKIVLQTLYGEVVKNLEISRIALMQQTPVIQILDYSTFPLEEKKVKLPIVLFVSFAIAIFLSVGYLFIRFLFKSQKQ